MKQSTQSLIYVIVTILFYFATVGTIINLFEQTKTTPQNVPCYDNNNNVILHQTCIANKYETSNMILLLFVFTSIIGFIWFFGKLLTVNN